LAIKAYRIPLPRESTGIEYGWRELEFQGFFPGNKLEGFKIVTVYADGGSLKKVLYSKPAWWDWTTKSQTIAGLFYVCDIFIRKALFIEI
jgi:hypothetical protein